MAERITHDEWLAAVHPSTQKVTICNSDDVKCLEDRAYAATRFIVTHPGMTPERFFAEIGPQYDLMRGGRCGNNVCSAAAEANNAPLITALLEREPKLLNRGTEFGHTPAMIAACEHSVEALRTLIEAGADINMASSRGCGDSRWGILPESTTPLRAALQCLESRKWRGRSEDHISKYVDIINMLVKHGGVALPQLTDEQIAKYEEILHL